jgi:hypothetical protein
MEGLFDTFCRQARNERSDLIAACTGMVADDLEYSLNYKAVRVWAIWRCVRHVAKTP